MHRPKPRHLLMYLPLLVVLMSVNETVMWPASSSIAMGLVSGSCSSSKVDVELVTFCNSLCKLQLCATDADTCGLASMQRAGAHALGLLPGRIHLIWGDGSCLSSVWQLQTPVTATSDRVVTQVVVSFVSGTQHPVLGAIRIDCCGSRS